MDLLRHSGALAVLFGTLCGILGGPSNAFAADADNETTAKAEKLSVIVKNPQKNCVPIVEVSSGNSGVAKTARNILEIVARTPFGRDMIEGGQKSNMTVCLSEDPEAFNGTPDISTLAMYSSDLNTLILPSRQTDNEFHAGEYPHEDQHRKQAAHGYVTDSALSFDRNLAREIELEIDANVFQLIATFMGSLKEYSAKPTSGPFQWAAGTKQITALIAARDENPIPGAGQGNSFAYGRNRVSTYETVTTTIDLQRPDRTKAAEALKKFVKDNPGSLDDGRAAKLLYDIFKQEGEIESIYTRTGLANEIREICFKVVNIATQAPDLLLGPEGASGMQEYLVTRGITRNEQVLKAVSEKLTKATSKNAVKMAREHPEWIESGRAARELYAQIMNNRTVQDVTRMLYDARKAEGHTLDIGDDFNDLGTINYKQDYRRLTLNLP